MALYVSDSCIAKRLYNFETPTLEAVFKYKFNYIRNNHLIYSNQSGFMPGHSTTHQLVHLYHVFCEALDNKKKVRLVFADISKAFDRVCMLVYCIN